MSRSQKPRQEVLFFDIMGTVLDWKASILPPLLHAPPTPSLPPESLPAFADAWRAGFFDEIHRMFAEGLEKKEKREEKGVEEEREGGGTEDIDVTHRRVLDRLLEQRGVGLDEWSEEIREELVQSWHSQAAWPDSVEAIERLKKKYFVCGLANGTTRLQLDITSSSGVAFHALFSSQLLGLTKPDPRIYLKALELVKLGARKATMVAAHAYDLRAAAKVGMRTIYIYRPTEDLHEDMNALKDEFDVFIDGTSIITASSLHTVGPTKEHETSTSRSGGSLLALADHLGV